MAMKTNRGKTLALWLLAVAVVGVSFFFDDALLAFMKTHTTPAVLAFGKRVSHYGQWNWLMVPCAVAAVITLLGRHTACLRILCVMVIACTLAGLAADAVRAATGPAPARMPPWRRVGMGRSRKAGGSPSIPNTRLFPPPTPLLPWD